MFYLGIQDYHYRLVRRPKAHLLSKNGLSYLCLVGQVAGRGRLRLIIWTRRWTIRRPDDPFCDETVPVSMKTSNLGVETIAQLGRVQPVVRDYLRKNTLPLHARTVSDVYI